MRIIFTICVVISFQVLYGQSDGATPLYSPVSVHEFGRKICVAKDESILLVGNRQEILTFSKSYGVWQLESNTISGCWDFYLTDDGKTLATSRSDAMGKRVFELFYRENNQWKKKGKPVQAEFSDNESLFLRMHFSDDGNAFIVSGYKRDPAIHTCHNCNQNFGTARVFQWDGTDWRQKGDALYGNKCGDNFGTTVKISADKSTIAVGSVYTNFGAKPRGKVEVFKLINGKWIQKGETITGLLEHEYFGAHISLDESGNHLSVFSFNYKARNLFIAPQLDYGSYSIEYSFQNGNWITQSSGAVITDKPIYKFYIFNSNTVLLHLEDGHSLFKFDGHSWYEKRKMTNLFYSFDWSDDTLFTGDISYRNRLGIVYMYPNTID